MTEEEKADELRFYVTQIYLIVKPVLGCILLSIFWVKISMSSLNFRRYTYRPAPSATQVYQFTDTSTTSEKFFGSLANAGIIVGQIIVMTIIIMVLFKYGCFKILFGFFMVVVVLLLGFMGYLLLGGILQVLSIPMDYITLVFGLWNFALVGLISVFWSKGPMKMQQAYLTIMSSLMAYSLTGLAEWTTWLLLGLLSIWGKCWRANAAAADQCLHNMLVLAVDLIAVLCPFGPLKMLIDSTKTQSKNVPALLYAVNAVWLMAFDERDYGGAAAQENTQQSAPSAYHTSAEHIALETRSEMRSTGDHPPPMPRSTSARVADSSTAAANAQRSAAPGNDSADMDQEEEEEAGLKLGLGDFVFYSVLIARADADLSYRACPLLRVAMSDWVTTVACTIAVMMGLNATIFLLAIKRKALPALPISIAFGILFYFVGSIMLVPCLEALSLAQIAL
ncbi:Presenilin-domain-containing protein [Thamnocephalis sphaerospora]|uniref:Presenilin-domain-containing protein n=1 Tax=Thamnocephalis sphaerospora TaxID=78915 RepID=A0A4P9XXL4_9FUNG|nr:Presenilin-domain-containing protein [Thamnocephalis sphaerospora]|eukprot:RKP11064.1 Presenilin-domain-containing protein [Thamnocephalis sphaerospora]